MTFQNRGTGRSKAAIVPTPGEIWHFTSECAPYPKFHLCVSFDRQFLLMNSPKTRSYSCNFELDEASVRRLPRNAQGISIVCCTRVIRQPDDVVLTPDDARGALRPEDMLDIAIHIDRHGLIERVLSRPWLPELFVWADAMRGR